MRIVDDIKARLFRESEPDSDVDDIGTDETVNTPAVVMYSTRFCPFCVRAKALLQHKNVRFRDIAVDGKPDLRREMAEKSGRHTVPQIWIGDLHVGGCDELMQLEREGRLDGLLQGS